MGDSHDRHQQLYTNAAKIKPTPTQKKHYAHPSSYPNLLSRSHARRIARSSSTRLLTLLLFQTRWVVPLRVVSRSRISVGLSTGGGSRITTTSDADTGVAGLGGRRGGDISAGCGSFSSNSDAESEAWLRERECECGCERERSARREREVAHSLQHRFFSSSSFFVILSSFSVISLSKILMRSCSSLQRSSFLWRCSFSCSSSFRRSNSFRQRISYISAATASVSTP